MSDAYELHLEKGKFLLEGPGESYVEGFLVEENGLPIVELYCSPLFVLRMRSEPRLRQMLATTLFEFERINGITPQDIQLNHSIPEHYIL